MQLRKNSDTEKSRYQYDSKALILPVLFFPKAAISNDPKAGLLTRFTFCGLPVIANSGYEDTKGYKKLTASGNVQDLHLFPFSFRF